MEPIEVARWLITIATGFALVCYIALHWLKDRGATTGDLIREKWAMNYMIFCVLMVWLLPLL